jgi:multidrug resistance efflux pump
LCAAHDYDKGRKMEMAELQTPVAPTAEQTPPTGAQTPPSGPQPTPKKKKDSGKKKLITRIIALVVLAAIIVAVVVWMRNFLFEDEDQQILTDVVSRGSIQSMVEGYGYTNAQNSASIVLSTGGTVEEVFVQNGDFVNEGDPLYTIDSTAAYEAVAEAEKTVSNYQKQLQAIYDSYADLEITAPFAGKLIDVEKITAGDNVGSGTRIATLVDDSKMKLSLYVNYAYQDQVYVGQTVRVSIPASMTEVSDATVEEINMVRYITPEGGQCFEVVVALNNPGTLTADMGATAVFTGSAGEEFYPYAPGTLEYYRTSDITTKASGEALSVYLINYIDVAKGKLLLKLSADDNEEQIASLENQLKTAQETLDKAQENLNNFNAVAPISGTVLSCSLVAGEQVSEGTTAITIADTSVMTVTLNVDERQIGYVEVGMSMELSDWNDNYYVGIVTDKALTGTTENGATSYPVTVEVDNPDGTLMSQMSLNYSFVASQADDCLIVPIQCTKYVSDADGNPISVVFVEADERPDNAVDLPEGLDGVPTEAEGFYAVPVETGISDTYNVEIISGLEKDQTVFTSYMTNSADSWGY